MVEIKNIVCACALLISFTVHADNEWRSYAQENDSVKIDNIFANIDFANTQKFSEFMQEYDELARIKTLLSQPNLPINAEGLLGDWRCRSIQVDNSGIYSYRYFNCKISQTEQNQLLFEKLSGSQKKTGYLFQDSSTDWVFLGGASVNDEPQLHYSGISSESNREYDVIGKLVQKKDKLVIAFDADNSSYELYELIR
ncbi:DUF4893 domain-containing protein [Corallincola holothuriorum]|uniref:DUF4893 domain-containing protein n=1 Tax=Corallincola holothuriorum TaxID=2282215 RepID=A0A368NKF4_9GAMM|nr:DUF4893 domain-containing protein [Corallincola holothuriorum]